MSSIISIISSIVVSGLVALGIMSSQPISTPNFSFFEGDINRLEDKIDSVKLGADNTKFVAGDVYSLKSSAAASDTTINLKSFNQPNSTINLTMADFGDIGYGTLEPGTSKKELISFTGITQNADGSAQLTGVSRGLGFVAPYTASATRQQPHSGGSKFIISNSPQLYNDVAGKKNDETITGLWTYSENRMPTVGGSLTATTSRQLVTKGLLDATTNQGAATSTLTNGGIVELGTALEVASSTDLGVSRPLVVTTNLGTSTPDTNHRSSQANHTIPVTQSDGYLSQDFIDLTENWRFTGDASVGTSTPWHGSTVAIEQNGTNPVFTIGDTGTSTPHFLVNAKGKTVINGNPYQLNIGGNGADGALNVTSGTTTLDATNNSYLVKNYTSISISSGAGLEISNASTTGTILHLKSQGRCDIDGVVYVGGKGSSGGTGGLAGTGVATIGLNGIGLSSATKIHGGRAGVNGGGAGGTAYETLFNDGHAFRLGNNIIATGSGGGGGQQAGNNNASGGAGGAGGGAIILECEGAYDFSATGKFSAPGLNGANGGNTNSVATAGGGGGGSGGMIFVRYAGDLDADAGTYIFRGGDGGNGGNSNQAASNVGGGGGGGSNYCIGGAGGGDNDAGSSGCGTDGGAGGAAGTGGGTGDGGGGGGGAEGLKVVIKI